MQSLDVTEAMPFIFNIDPRTVVLSLEDNLFIVSVFSHDVALTDFTAMLQPYYVPHSQQAGAERGASKAGTADGLLLQPSTA